MGTPVATCIAGLAVALIAPLSAAPVAWSAPSEPTISTSRSSEASIVDRTELGARLLELTVRTDAFVTAVPVRVILPVGYRRTNARFPVIYYTAGTNSDQTRFTDTYEGVRLTRDLRAIVVVPRGDSGYWSDWTETAISGQHDYERFVAGQLVPLVDRTFRTQASRASRAIVGESMGGYGAMMLAARHPDLFVAAASLSGVTDTNLPAVAEVVTASPALQGGAPGAIYGPRSTNEVRWRGHNPVDLARNLRGLDLQVLTGNGTLGLQQGEVANDAAGCPVEAIVERASTSLHDQLTRLNIPHRFMRYPYGCHSTVLFQHEFTIAARRIVKVFAQQRRNPARFDFRAVERRSSPYRWTFAADATRRREFLDLRDVSRAGLSVRGTGVVTVTTPRYNTDRVKAVVVTVAGRARTHRLRTDGRLRFRVALGPAADVDQFDPTYVDRRATRRIVLRPVPLPATPAEGATR